MNRHACRLTWLATFAVCLVTCLPIVASADEARNVRVRERLKSGVIRWGGDTEGGAPFQYRDANNPDSIIGFEVDVVEAAVEQLRTQLNLPQLRAEFVQFDWVSLPQGLEKHDFDLIVSGMEITRGNTAKMAFTRPYYLFAQQLTVRADETRIQSVEDCRELRVGTLSGSAAYHLLEKLGIKNIVTFDGQIESYQDLGIGRVDAVLLDLPIAAYNTKNNARLKFVGELVGWGGYGMAARRDDADLVAALSDAIAALQEADKLEAIYRRWDLWTDEQRELSSLGDAEALMRWAATKNGGDDEAPAEWTFARYAPLLLQAAFMTVDLSFRSMALAMALGLVVAVARLYGPTPIRWLALAYVEFFRGIPLLLLLTVLYFGLPTIGVDLSAFSAAILGFGLNYAAFEAEIYRSSILSVPRGQWEAASALGMNEVTTFRRVVFPQAFRTALGPMTNDFVAMFKDTSLVSVIGVVELTKQYNILARTSFKFVEIGLLTAALYLAMSVPLGYLARYLEDRWSAGHK